MLMRRVRKITDLRAAPVGVNPLFAARVGYQDPARHRILLFGSTADLSWSAAVMGRTCGEDSKDRAVRRGA
jgi:hypothetical protein